MQGKTKTDPKNGPPPGFGTLISIDHYILPASILFSISFSAIGEISLDPENSRISGFWPLYNPFRIRNSELRALNWPQDPRIVKPEP